MTHIDPSLLHRKLPDELAALAELALDLRWTWSHAADALWSTIEPAAWEATQNPWFILQNASEAKLERLARDPAFVHELERLIEERASYHAASSATPATGRVAFFCMEFGLGAAVPLYAGGLGILAGDFLKTASDLRLPITGVGLLYQEGYFRQTIDARGRQHETYPYNDPSGLPIQPALAGDGRWARVAVPLPGRNLWLRIWRARVGRVELFLLDGNDPENKPADRGATAKLYASDPETRLLQELALGIGGPRALELLDKEFVVAHLNEGHAAFAVLERARRFGLEHGSTFDEALMATRAGNVFTTHTPAPAGFDTFDPAMVRRYMDAVHELRSVRGYSVDAVLELGRDESRDGGEVFSMARLALRGSARANGVSRLHGEVSRGLFAGCFPRWPVSEVPIEHVTNGVHMPSWDSPAADELWTNACGKARWLGAPDLLPSRIQLVPDDALWSLRSRERRELVDRVRVRAAAQFLQRDLPELAESAASMLDPNVLTLGFARRFAEYKRPALLLHDPERLARLLCSMERPVQLVIAGKAHPADAAGKRMIAAWHSFVDRPEVRGRAAFLEDYDMTIGEEMVRGVDVWLNTPRRPWEACGTSGMKILVNGGLNLSVLDGWWAEAYTPAVGWALGDHENGSDEGDARRLYELLEQDVVPEFYRRDSTGVPREWITRVRASMADLTPRFSSNRMLREYATRFYAPATRAYTERAASSGATAKALSEWQEHLERYWNQIHFGASTVDVVEDGFDFRVAVYLGEIGVEDVQVELYADGDDYRPPFRAALERMEPLRGAVNGHVFGTHVTGARDSSDYTARVVPRHPAALVPSDVWLITWQR